MTHVTDADGWHTGQHVTATVNGKRLRGTFVIVAIICNPAGQARHLNCYGPIENIRLGGRCQARSFWPNNCTLRNDKP